MTAVTAITPHLATVECPDVLRSLPAWLIWRYEHHDGEPKARKVPYYTSGGKRHGMQGRPEDRAQLVTFDAARTAAVRKGFDGVGFCPLPEWGITALDFDRCVVDGGLHPEVERVVLGTYAEWSPSGQGVRAFFRGDLGNPKSHGLPFGLEVFSTKGFVTFTGNTLEVTDLAESANVIAEVTPEILQLCEQRFGRAQASPAGAGSTNTPPVGLSRDVLREALAVLDPIMGHDSWLRVGMALHHETCGEALDLWDEWSSGGAQYPGRDALRARWESFGRGGRRPTTVHALVRMANEAGAHINLADAAVNDFEVLDGLQKLEAMPLPSFKRDKGGHILATVENVTLALRRPDVCGLELAYDSFRDELMLTPPGLQEWRAFTDADYVRLRTTLERGGFKAVGRDLIRDVVCLIADENQFDSAQVWLEALKWDSVPRVERFFVDHFGAEDGPYAHAVARYTWTAMAGRVLDPGCQADMVPVLIGPQGSGKTRGVAAMVPSPEHVVGVNLDVRDADTARLLRGVLVGEIGELRGLHTRDSESIKDFISRTHERWVPKFKEFSQFFPRRVVFIGTTNQDEFLADETGNRRWLPLRVQGCDPARVASDREQLWAEAAALWSASGVEFEAAQRLGAATHAEHTLSDPWEDPVCRWLDECELGETSPRGEQPVRLEEVLRGALGFDSRAMKRADQTRVGKILRGLGFEKSNVRVDGEQKKCWVKGSNTSVDRVAA